MKRENRRPNRAEWERITSHGIAAPVVRRMVKPTEPRRKRQPDLCVGGGGVHS